MLTYNSYVFLCRKVVWLLYCTFTIFKWIVEKNLSKYHTNHKSNLSALGFVLYLGGLEYMSSCGCWQLTFLDTHGLENRQLFVHNQLALRERTLLSFQVVARFNVLLDFDYTVWFKGLFTTTMRQTLKVLFFFYAYSIIIQS